MIFEHLLSILDRLESQSNADTWTKSPADQETPPEWA